MRKHLKVVWFLLFALLLTSCSAPGTPAASPTEMPLPTPTTPPVSTPMPGHAERTTVTIGMMNFSTNTSSEFGQGRIETVARMFNANSREYMVKIEYYGDFSETNSDALLALNAALTSNDHVPDLLYLTGLPTEAYIQRGLLMDLSPLMEADGKLTRENMLPCVREASEVDGKIFYLSPDCSLFLYGGSSETLMTEDFADTEQIFRALGAEQNEGRTLMQDEGASAFVSADALADRFVDYRSGTCDFQSEEFLRVLELLDSLPRDPTQRFSTSASLTPPSNALWVTEGYSVMFYNTIHRFEAYAEMETLMEGDYVPAEYLFSDGKYALCTLETPVAIPVNARNPEGAWAFIKYLFQPVETIDRHELPTTYSGLEGMLINSGLPKLWETQREGEEDVRQQMRQEMNDPYGLRVGEEVTSVLTYPYTEEVYEEFLELLEKPMILQIGGSRSAKTAELQTMISDEINAFLSGNATAEQTAQTLQSRVGIYLAEQS